MSGASSGQHFQFGHQWIGLLLFLGLGIQAGLGWYHHKRYEEDKPTERRWFTHAHLWFGRFILFLALINIGLGIQLYGDGAGAQAVWYLLTIAVVATYAFFYWRIHYQKRKRINDSFDPSPFEEGAGPPPDGPGSPFEPYRPVNVAAMSDNDLGTYRSEYYDPEEAGLNEYGSRASIHQTPTITAVNRPSTAAIPSSSAGRRYDFQPTPSIPGPYGPTEPLRPGALEDPLRDPFADPRPRTGNRPRTAAPYPVTEVDPDEFPPALSAPPYVSFKILLMKIPTKAISLEGCLSNCI